MGKYGKIQPVDALLLLAVRCVLLPHSIRRRQPPRTIQPASRGAVQRSRAYAAGFTVLRGDFAFELVLYCAVCGLRQQTLRL